MTQVALHRRRGLAWLSVSLLVGALLLASAAPAVAHRRGHRVAGTISAIGAGTFTVTEADGDTVDVATTDDTHYLEITDATVADAVVGSFVHVRGARSDDGTTVAADRIAIVPRRGRGAAEVLSNDGSTLTVETRRGVVTVTTDDETEVTRTAEITFADLAVGDEVEVHASRGEDGTLTARSVKVDSTD